MDGLAGQLAQKRPRVGDLMTQVRLRGSRQMRVGPAMVLDQIASGNVGAKRRAPFDRLGMGTHRKEKRVRMMPLENRQNGAVNALIGRAIVEAQHKIPAVVHAVGEPSQHALPDWNDLSDVTRVKRETRYRFDILCAPDRRQRGDADSSATDPRDRRAPCHDPRHAERR